LSARVAISRSRFISDIVPGLAGAAMLSPANRSVTTVEMRNVQRTLSKVANESSLQLLLGLGRNSEIYSLNKKGIEKSYKVFTSFVFSPDESKDVGNIR
jgi:hypothetical protein